MIKFTKIYIIFYKLFGWKQGHAFLLWQEKLILSQDLPTQAGKCNEKCPAKDARQEKYLSDREKFPANINFLYNFIQ